MRMWMVDPKMMCNKHLLGEHVETHMLEGSIRMGKSVEGFIKNGLVNLDHLKHRHDCLAAEMENRGMNHKSPLIPSALQTGGEVDQVASLMELGRRCPACRERIKECLTAYVSNIGDES